MLSYPASNLLTHPFSSALGGTSASRPIPPAWPGELVDPDDPNDPEPAPLTLPFVDTVVRCEVKKLRKSLQAIGMNRDDARAYAWHVFTFHIDTSVMPSLDPVIERIIGKSQLAKDFREVMEHAFRWQRVCKLDEFHALDGYTITVDAVLELLGMYAKDEVLDILCLSSTTAANTARAVAASQVAKAVAASQVAAKAVV